MNFTRSRRTHCARVHCTSPPRTIYSSTRPRRPFSSTRSCLRLLRDFAQRAGSITPLRLEVLCRCSTHTHARRRRLPRCRFAPPRPNRHLLCGAAAAPSSPQSNISTLASFASRRHFLDGTRLGPPRVSSGSLPSTPFARHWNSICIGSRGFNPCKTARGCARLVRETRSGDERRRDERTFFHTFTLPTRPQDL